MNQIFDDGSVLTYGADGALVSGRDSSGKAINVPPPGGSAVVQQFANLITYGVRSALDRATGTAPSAAAGTPATTASSPLSRYLPMALIAAGALLLYKLFAK